MKIKKNKNTTVAEQPTERAKKISVFNYLEFILGHNS